jgi:hypothetical protein
MMTKYETSHALKTETIKNCHAPQQMTLTLKSPLSVWSSNQSLIATYDNSKNMHWWKQHLGCHALVKGATPKLSRDHKFCRGWGDWFHHFFFSHNGSTLVIARLTVTKVADFCLLFIHTYLTYHQLSPPPLWKNSFFSKKKKSSKKKVIFFCWKHSTLTNFYIFWSLWKNTSPLLIRNWKKVPCVSISHWD